MAINYGEDDYPYIKEALREYIVNHPDCNYNYKKLYTNFKTQPCTFCEDTTYDPDIIERFEGRLICGKCWKKIRDE